MPNQTLGMPTDRKVGLAKALPDITQLALRLGLAGIFWSAARTKVEGAMTISENTIFLFAEEYRLPLLSPEFAAYLTTYAEHLLPLALVFGIGTRAAAFGLLIMTLVIQIFVYPAAFASTHLGWMALALAVIAYGPGRFALDQLLFGRRAS